MHINTQALRTITQVLHISTQALRSHPQALRISTQALRTHVRMQALRALTCMRMQGLRTHAYACICTCVRLRTESLRITKQSLRSHTQGMLAHASMCVRICVRMCVRTNTHAYANATFGLSPSIRNIGTRRYLTCKVKLRTKKRAG